MKSIFGDLVSEYNHTKFKLVWSQDVDKNTRIQDLDFSQVLEADMNL